MNTLSKLLIISFLFLSLGATLFLFQRTYLIIIKRPQYSHLEKEVTIKKMNVSLLKKDTLITEEISFPSSNVPELELNAMLRAWLKLYQDYRLIKPETHIQDIAFSITKKILFISFSATLFIENDELLKKASLLKNLALGLKALCPKIEEFFLLVDHKPMEDSHITCYRAFSIRQCIELI